MQKRLILILFLLACLATVAYYPEPDENSQKIHLPEQILDTTTSYSGGSFSFDEKRILVSSDETGVFNAYSLPVHGGKAAELTNSANHPVYIATYFPEDDRLLYHMVKKDCENKHLYLREGDGSIRDLVPVKNTRTEFFGWAHDRKSFFYLSDKRNDGTLDLYEMNSETLEAELIYANDHNAFLRAISPDKKYLVLTNPVSQGTNSVYLYDTHSNKPLKLFSEENLLSIEPAVFSLNSQKLYYIIHEGEYSVVKSVECETGKEAIEQREKGEIASFELSHQGAFRLITMVEPGKRIIKIFDNTSGKPIKLPKLPDGDVTLAVISRSESKMLLKIRGDGDLSNLYLVDLGKGTLQKLTQHLKSPVS